MNKKSLSETHPDLIKEWDYEKNDEIGIKPENVSHGCHKKLVDMYKKIIAIQQL